MPQRIAIMQPYFFPYIGYFQLISHVNQFVIYDDIKYTKKGWINRNRMLGAEGPVTFTLPLKQGADQSNIAERSIAADFDAYQLLRRLTAAYKSAPFYFDTIKLVERVLMYDDRNLFRFLEHSLVEICSFLKISTPLLTSSNVLNDTSYRGQERVIAMCRALSADEYINPQNGVSLYSANSFHMNAIKLKFLFSQATPYDQGRGSFVENLSIIDVMMFNHRDCIGETILSQCNIIDAINKDDVMSSLTAVCQSK